MINLLEPSVRRSLNLRYQLRRVAALLTLLAVAFLVGAGSLLPAYLLSKAKEREVSLSAMTLEESLAARGKNELSSELVALREKINALETDASAKAYEVLTAILVARPNSVAVNNFFYTRKGTTWESQVVGVAATRDTLLAYQKELKKNILFTDVDLPINNLAKEKEIGFTLTLSGNFLP